MSPVIFVLILFFKSTNAGLFLRTILEEKNLLTRGLEQLIGNILDKHEEHLYLLQQRNTNT